MCASPRPAPARTHAGGRDAPNADTRVDERDAFGGVSVHAVQVRVEREVQSIAEHEVFVRRRVHDRARHRVTERKHLNLHVNVGELYDPPRRAMRRERNVETLRPRRDLREISSTPYYHLVA